MNIFEEISFINEKIKKVQDKLEYLQMNIDSPRSSVMSDMPRGGGCVGNPLEQYIERKEEYEEKLHSLEKRLDNLWADAYYLMDSAKIDSQVQVMMYLRIAEGLRWEKCAQTLAKKYPDGKWNVNKCFRKYREVLSKTRR